eukprot:gb/GECG01005548.1/.p1 GENE.gb/GECG01005548.1/~~gb/GECG01005548.1/.p1  ORF type:complete len:413 (+),score=68.40 gb/GECG01005548.1/:1-1239(+)
MRITHRSIREKDGEGFITCIAEDAEDMWHIYNILTPGDTLRASTMRKVVQESETGARKSDKKKLWLTIGVEETEFDAEAQSIRVKGKNKVENEHVKLGAYHTIDLETGKSFTITKECWDTIFLERLEAAVDIANKADVAAVVMSQGKAQVCLITGYVTIVRTSIDMNIPKKRAGSTGHDKAVQKFFSQLLDGLRRHVNLDKVKTVIVASPGFLREDFHKFVLEEAVRCGYKEILNNKDKFLLAHSSGGHKQSLQEVLKDDNTQKILEKAKAGEEMEILNSFFEMLHKDPDKAMYSYKHVHFACERGAIETLLITDDLFRSSNVTARKKYIKLVEDTREQGGKVYIFSTMHVSGEQLNMISGVAAILRFPLPEIDEMLVADAASQSRGKQGDIDELFVTPLDDEGSSSSEDES